MNYIKSSRDREHRNELVLLLDELLRKDGIDREEYTLLSTILAEPLGSGVEEEAEEDKTEDNKEKVKTIIQIEYSIQQ